MHCHLTILNFHYQFVILKINNENASHYIRLRFPRILLFFFFCLKGVKAATIPSRAARTTYGREGSVELGLFTAV